MSDPFLVVMVFGDSTSRIATTTNLHEAFRLWRRRHGAFLPVIAFQMPLELLPPAVTEPRLPKTVPTQWAADLLHRAPVSQDAQLPVTRHIKWLGPRAVPLFRQWRSAVLAVQHS